MRAYYNTSAVAQLRIMILEKGKLVKDLLTSTNTLDELEGVFNPETSVEMDN